MRVYIPADFFLPHGRVGGGEGKGGCMCFAAGVKRAKLGSFLWEGGGLLRKMWDRVKIFPSHTRVFYGCKNIKML